MIIKCSDICGFMNRKAPERLAEDWDNVGLLIGSMDKPVSSLLVALDVTAEVAQEACRKNVDMIISHHPLIFKGIKNVVKERAAGSIIYKLIKSDISLYSSHTNFDVAKDGLNSMLASTLELKNVSPLKKYMEDKLYKVVVYVPEGFADKIREAMTSEGAGWIGNYSDCTFQTNGTGTFKPLEGTNPFIGSKGKLEHVNEARLETVVPEQRLKSVLSSMLSAHPYEEVAYDVYKLELEGSVYGLGTVGMLEEAMNFKAFTDFVKQKLETQSLRVIGTMTESIKKVAAFCGSFDDDWQSVLLHKPDVLVTGDIKYHAAVEARQLGLCVIDAGHFNTEKIFTRGAAKLLKQEFPEVNIICSAVEADPVKIT